ncbi:hypothetical protein QQX09_03360 [Demequina sp. SYSU T00192]|uniref:Fis family transcriptional regulator n=1 Tax=Demequina litoralis TaxID=3051660 RepID=A0ABT8G6Y9_9MICO|nr:hypothetical protein [Demequina sp. SYSU T00192]MDN4474891.1 hypothetical protein [Demequina sp. SYSU T00192]
MRWELLFADLESRLDAEERADVDAEIAERTRDERAAVVLAGRLAAHAGLPASVVLRGGGRAVGTVADVAGTWVLLDAPDGQAVVPLDAVAAIDGLGHASAPLTEVRRRLSVASALRELAEAGLPVRVETDGGAWRGVIVSVGADHLDLAVDSTMRAVPLGAVVAVRTG